MRRFAFRLSVLALATVLVLPALALAQPDTTGNSATPPQRLDLAFVLPDSDIVPPDQQREMFVAIATDRLGRGAVDVDQGFRTGRVLRLSVMDPPFTRRERVVADPALQARVVAAVAAWMEQLEAIAAADARQRRMAADAALAGQLAEARARLEVVETTLGALAGSDQSARAQALLRERDDLRVEIAELRVAVGIGTRAAIVPIRPELVPEVGDGALIAEALATKLAGNEPDDGDRDDGNNGGGE